MAEITDPIPLSALQHWCYCPRQCGLIHLEQVFADNVYTLRGHAAHAAVDKPGFEVRIGVRVDRALPIWYGDQNTKIHLIGKADVVEYLTDGTPYPVEYKVGSRNKLKDIAHCDDIQLVAQAMCLEKMNQCSVPTGAIFYAKSKRRKEIEVSQELRDEVITAAQAVQQMMESGLLPSPTEDITRCRACSLNDICQPESLRALQDNPNCQKNLFDPEH